MLTSSRHLSWTFKITVGCEQPAWERDKHPNNNSQVLNFGLTWTAQLRKQLFWPGPLRSPLVSVNWWLWFEGEVKKFIGKFFMSGRGIVEDARCGGKVVPTVMILFQKIFLLSFSFYCWFMAATGIICGRNRHRGLKIVLEFKSKQQKKSEAMESFQLPRKL